MTRRYDEPVDVRRRDDVPAEFLWRGRLYVVREVLSHWVEAGAWWRSSQAQPVYGESGPAGHDAAGPASAAAAESADAGVSLLDDGEREVWRVEASAGRVRGGGVYDLVFDWSAGTWSLARALD